MRTVMSVPPATALVGHVKEGAADSASPANQASSGWERSVCPSAGKDIMQKLPQVNVSDAIRAARAAGARDPQTVCLVIHFSSCCTPRESVGAPAQTTTMQTKENTPA